MRIHDISIPLQPGIPVWPGDPELTVERRLRIEDGDGVNVSYIAMGTHTGTHLDPPVHFIPGARGVDELDLEMLIGPADVVAFDVEEAIHAADLERAGLPDDTRRLLCKTRNSQEWVTGVTAFRYDFVYLAPDAARWLVDRGIRLVGVDYLSVEGFALVDQGAPTHRTLLGAGVIVVEGLNLADVPPGRYTLVCLPLRIQGGDGAPCRAVLLEEGPGEGRD